MSYRLVPDLGGGRDSHGGHSGSFAARHGGSSGTFSQDDAAKKSQINIPAHTMPKSGAYASHKFNMIDNYIYFYHIDKFMLIPCYPDSIADQMGVDFQSSTPLSRSAPIFSYSKSGPRSFNINIKLHRDMMQDINYNRSNYVLNNLAAGDLNDDYVDALAKELQAAAIPNYLASSKTVKPPMIAVRFGNEIFCKGVIQSSVTVTYSGPLLSYENGDKYASVEFSFTMVETDPYSADMVVKNGSFRGLNSTLEKGLFKTTDYKGAGNRAVDEVQRLA